MSFSAKAVAGAAVAAAVCLSAAGCGQSDPLAGQTARQIYTKALSNLKSAPSFTLAAVMVVQGGKSATSSIGIKGHDCILTMDDGSKDPVTAIVIGNSVWMKAEGGGGASADKYLKGPADTGGKASSTAGMCDLSQANSFVPPPSTLKNLVKGGVTTVNGQRVVTLIEKGEKSEIDVTDTSAPRIIRVLAGEQKQKGINSARLTITYGVPKSITAPPASETTIMPSIP